MRRLGVRREARFSLVRPKEDHELQSWKARLIKEMDALLEGSGGEPT